MNNREQQATATAGGECAVDEKNSPVECFRKELPSGRALVMSVGEQGEKLEVLGKDGMVETVITFTDHGPVVRLRATALELDSVQSVAVQCARFRVEASESVDLRSSGDVRVESARHTKLKSTGDMRLNGQRVLLNCTKL